MSSEYQINRETIQMQKHPIFYEFQRFAKSAGSRIDLAIQALIVISLVSFSLETLPDLSTVQRIALAWVERVTVAIFTVEYLIRFAMAERKSSFVFSFFGLVDLVSILPFYLSFGIDLRSVRVFRLLRIFRILKLGRYSRAVKRFHTALLIAREELILYLMLTMILVYLSSVGIYYFENGVQPDKFSSIFSSLWWSVVTLTTVGYGDVYPITAGGRLFTFVVLMIGLGIVSVPAGLVASSLNQAREMEDDEESGA